jgi:hypothetical protein
VADDAAADAFGEPWCFGELDMYIISCENYKDHEIENDHRDFGVSISSGGQ